MLEEIGYERAQSCSGDLRILLIRAYLLDGYWSGECSKHLQDPLASKFVMGLACVVEYPHTPVIQQRNL